VVLEYPARISAIEQELTHFDAHMRDVWGLADNTRRKRCRVVGGFLVEHFGEQPISMATVNATSIRRFVLGKQGREDPPPSPRTALSLAAISVSAACPASGWAI